MDRHGDESDCDQCGHEQHRRQEMAVTDAPNLLQQLLKLASGRLASERKHSRNPANQVVVSQSKKKSTDSTSDQGSEEILREGLKPAFTCTIVQVPLLLLPASQRPYDQGKERQQAIIAHSIQHHFPHFPRIERTGMNGTDKHQKLSQQEESQKAQRSHRRRQKALTHVPRLRTTGWPWPTQSSQYRLQQETSGRHHQPRGALPGEFQSPLPIQWHACCQECSRERSGHLHRDAREEGRQQH
jgi:hypothetical protein